MIHPNEDQLLNYCLQLDQPAERECLEEHLTDCAACRAVLASIEADINLLRRQTLQPLRRAYPLPRRLRAVATRWLRIAAALLVVTAAGGWLARAIDGRIPAVEPMRLAITLPPDSLQVCFSCAADGFWVPEP